MRKKDLFLHLEQITSQKPECAKEIEELVMLVQKADNVDDVLHDYLSKHSRLADCFEDISGNAQGLPGKVFPVHKPFSSEIRQRMKLAERDEHYRNWANAVKALPEYTSPIPDVDADYILNAKEIWNKNIYGNEDILQVILRHSIEYSKTGKTVPILLVGDPGAGKTLVAKNYGRILNLPGTFISGPSASAGRGLSGAPNIFVGAGVGAIVQAMIDHGIGNPVCTIDEIDKAGRCYSRGPDFQDELLAVLDESNKVWRDNFLEVDVDASHIPFIFTANESDMISAPLLDRMEVVKMETPTLEMIHCITREFTLPDALKEYDSDRIEFGNHELHMLVDMLWFTGNRSNRAYQKAVKLLVSNAYLNAVMEGKNVKITEKEIKKTVEMCSGNRRSKRIGFIA